MAKNTNRILDISLVAVVLLIVYLVYRFGFTKKTDTNRSANTNTGNTNTGNNNNNNGGNNTTPETWSDVSPALTDCMSGKTHKRQISNKGNQRWFATTEDCGTEVEEGTRHAIGTMTVSGSTLDLAVYYLAGKWRILREWSNRASLHPCGKNILNNYAANYTLPSGVTVTSQDTALDGLSEPSDFPYSTFLTLFPTYEKIETELRLT